MRTQITHTIRQSSQENARVWLAATTLLLMVGCGGSNRSNSDAMGNGTGSAIDASVAIDTGVAIDAGMGDTGSDTPPPPPPPLVQGHYTIESGMSDGHFLVHDQAGAASAVDESSGAVHAIVAGATSFRGFAKVGFVWSNSNARLHIWTAASGARQIASATTQTVAASSDGMYVAYYDNVQGDLADLYVNRTDVDQPHKLLTGTHIGIDCSPVLGFVASRLIASHCEGVTVTAGTVTSWSLADQSHLDLQAAGFSAWRADRAEKHIFVLDLNHDGWVVTPTDATLVPIGSSIQRSLFSPDSKSILYRTTPGGMFREAAGGGTPTTLQTNGVFGIYSVSPDASAVLFTSGFDAQNVLSDLKLTSAIQNDVVVTLNAAQTSGFMGPGFTADSRYAVYGQGIDPTYFVGSMYAVSAGGGAPRLVAAGVDVWYTLDAAKLVYNDHFTPGGELGTADIEALDLDAVGAAPKLLATQASGIFLLTSDNHAVLFATENGSQGAGIYRLALP